MISSMQNFFSITTITIPVDQLTNNLENKSCGAVVTFAGKVRNHHDDKIVLSLTYEVYIPMAKKIFLAIATEAKKRFGVQALHIVHRVGPLAIGEVAVWIGVESSHRKEAFLACQYAIDEIKKRAPIWKKEIYKDGKSQWVETCDHS